MASVDSFPFLRLPTELRLQIYREIFIDSGTIELSPIKKSPTDNSLFTIGICPRPDRIKFNLLRIPLRLNVSLLGTNRQINEEASEVLYQGNIIELALDVGPFNGEFDFGGRDIFLTMIGQGNRGRLKEFRVMNRLGSVIYTGGFLN